MTGQTEGPAFSRAFVMAASLEDRLSVEPVVVIYIHPVNTLAKAMS